MKQTMTGVLFGAMMVVGISATGCRDSAAPFDVAAMKQIIQARTDQFTQAHILRDTTFLNNIVTEDAKAYPPNNDAVIGRAAIAALNAEWVSFDIKEFREETMDFYGNNEYLIDEGTYYLRYGEDDIIDKGKYINIWKHVDGDWKIYSNMWNTSMPVE